MGLRCVLVHNRNRHRAALQDLFHLTGNLESPLSRIRFFKIRNARPEEPEKRSKSIGRHPGRVQPDYLIGLAARALAKL